VYFLVKANLRGVMGIISKPLELEAMIEKLIATPSVSCIDTAIDQSNAAVIHILAEWLEKLGFQTQILAIDDKNEKFNLIATIGKGCGGLVLAGHTDTVPYDLNRWTTDPFKLKEKNHRYYGLGTSDMKAFLAIAIEAAKSFSANQYQAPLTILATADEETTMAGAKALVELGQPKAKHAIIGEPTGLKPIRLHKGVMMEKIRVVGLAGHSSNPKLGHNAIEGMMMVLNYLSNWRNELASKHQNPLFEIAHPTLNFGHIHGGDNPNRICAESEIHIDIRPLPGMQLDQIRQELRHNLNALFSNSPFKVYLETLFSGIPAMETPATAEIVKIAEQLTGHQAESVAFGTEAPYLNQLGMNTIVFGPGNIDQAHQKDEYLELKNITPSIDILKKMIGRLCITP
jgi:acetylornithine deacetylase